MTHELNPLKLLIAFLFLAYPILVYFGLESLGAKGLALMLLVAVGIRLLLQRTDRTESPLLAGFLASLALAVLVSLLTLASNSPYPLRYYPVAMNLAMLVLFGLTLLYPPSVIERIARLRQSELEPYAIRYTRTVTQVWCAFFVVNGSIALYTAMFTELATWALYNGMIAYLLMAALFIGEFAVRRQVQRRHRAAADAQ